MDPLILNGVVPAPKWCPAVSELDEQRWWLQGGGPYREALTNSSCLPRGLMSHCIAILKVILPEDKGGMGVHQSTDCSSRKGPWEGH